MIPAVRTLDLVPAYLGCHLLFGVDDATPQINHNFPEARDTYLCILQITLMGEPCSRSEIIIILIVVLFNSFKTL